MKANVEIPHGKRNYTDLKYVYTANVYGHRAFALNPET